MTMAARSLFLIQLLQKMGAPLMAAINARAEQGDTQPKEAAVLASLLSESVQSGIALSQAMNLKTEDGDPDAIRVALSALSAQLIAENYKATGRVPAEADRQKMTKALESIIVFSDNFAPAAEHAQRLQTLDDAPVFFDPVQAGLYSMHALLPVISAIGEFSFGQSESRLVQDVAARLGARAAQTQGKLGPSSNKMAELVLLQAFAALYASCHRAQTSALKQSGGDGASLESVWAAFDKQAAMLDVLVGAMGGEDAAGGGSGSGTVKPNMETSAPPAPSAPPAQTSGGGSPMSFFKKK